MGILRPGLLRIRNQVLTATATGANITIPAAAQGGAAAFLFDVAAQVGLPTDVTPTDWTSIVGANDGSITRLRVSRRILPAGLGGTSVTGMDGTDDQKGMLVFHGTSPFHAVTASSWNSEITGNNPSQQTVSAGGQKTPLIVFGIVAEPDDGPVSFSTASPAWDGTLTVNSGDMVIGWKIYNGGPVAHTVDMGDFGNTNVLASGYVILS